MYSVFGAQYVNYSNITLKAGGPHTLTSETVAGGVHVQRLVAVEARINTLVLRVPPCGKCANCIDTSINSRKMCQKRLEARNKLYEEEHAKMTKLGDKYQHKSPINGLSMKAKTEGINGKKLKSEKKKPGPKPGEHYRKPLGNPLGNKRMAVTDEGLRELCQIIGPQGTNERMRVINDFAKAHPETSVRQVTIRFGEIVTKYLPACVEPPEKKAGRAVTFFLRPRLYHYLAENERPLNWEKYAQ